MQFRRIKCVSYNDNVLISDAYPSILYLNGGVLYIDCNLRVPFVERKARFVNDMQIL